MQSHVEYEGMSLLSGFPCVVFSSSVSTKNRKKTLRCIYWYLAELGGNIFRDCPHPLIDLWWWSSFSWWLCAYSSQF